MIRYPDWKRPTDKRYAFPMRELPDARPPPLGTVTDIRDVALRVLGAETAERFASRIARWSGPEDRNEQGEQPYAAQQLFFEEALWSEHLTRAQLEPVLEGRVQVYRRGNQVDVVMRDHHTLDLALYHHATGGAFPQALFHADRHSDWCSDSFLQARLPDQAATWWALLEGLKRPDGAPFLKEQNIHFATAQAPRDEKTQGRDVGASVRVPGWMDPDPALLTWDQALARPGALDADWVSVDLDYMQPCQQFRLGRPLLRDSRFQTLMRNARVRLFVLSPQFTRGGDRFDHWTVHGSLSSSLRLMNLLRRM